MVLVLVQVVLVLGLGLVLVLVPVVLVPVVLMLVLVPVPVPLVLVLLPLLVPLLVLVTSLVLVLGLGRVLGPAAILTLVLRPVPEMMLVPVVQLVVGMMPATASSTQMLMLPALWLLPRMALQSLSRGPVRPSPKQGAQLLQRQQANFTAIATRHQRMRTHAPAQYHLRRMMAPQLLLHWRRRTLAGLVRSRKLSQALWHPASVVVVRTWASHQCPNLAGSKSGCAPPS